MADEKVVGSITPGGKDSKVTWIVVAVVIAVVVILGAYFSR